MNIYVFGKPVTEVEALEQAKALEASLRKMGQDVTLLGLSKKAGCFEVVVNGKQESMKLNADWQVGTVGDAFVRDTIRIRAA